MSVQGAINSAIGSVGAGVAIAKGVKAEQVKAEAIKQEQVQAKKEATASNLVKLGSNEQMLADIQEKIRGLTDVRDEKKANLDKYGNMQGITKGAKQVLEDAYQSSQLALEGAIHQQEGLMNYNKMYKELLKGGK